MIPIGVVAGPARRLGTWDALQLPAPFARAVFVVAPPVSVATDADPAEAVGRVQAALADAAAAARAALGAAAP